jgi:hypothetical protein
MYIYGRPNHRSASNSSAVGLSLGSNCIVLQMKSLSSCVTSSSFNRMNGLRRSCSSMWTWTAASTRFSSSSSTSSYVKGKGPKYRACWTRTCTGNSSSSDEMLGGLNRWRPLPQSRLMSFCREFSQLWQDGKDGEDALHTVAPKDHMSVGVDHFNPSNASGLRKMAAPMTCLGPVPRGSMACPTCYASPTRHDR